MPTELAFSLPVWTEAYILQYQPTTDINRQMQFILDAVKQNIQQQSGGPFAAGIFNEQNGKLLALGVNLVTSEQVSSLHAEIVALSLAQRKLHAYNLGQQADRYQLVSSCEPCAMCLGAIPWSGIHTLVSSARDVDARTAGFNEGLKPKNWRAYYNSQGITVISDIKRQTGAELLKSYSEQGGEVYNSRGGND